MDSYREHSSDFDLPGPAGSSAADDVAAAIGTDERRMHVRAYNYWVSLLDGRDFPSIEDLEPGDVHDFAAHSVLLDFTCGRDNPGDPLYRRRAPRGMRPRRGHPLDRGRAQPLVAVAPDRSLYADHRQPRAGRLRGRIRKPALANICYRGILMPFSSDGETIDFIYGVINWKAVPAVAAAPSVSGSRRDRSRDGTRRQSKWTRRVAPSRPGFLGPPTVDEPPAPVPHVSWQDGPLAESADREPAIPAVPLDEDAALADRLSVARESADAVKGGEARTRTALYRALSLAYDFAHRRPALPGGLRRAAGGFRASRRRRARR